MVLYEFRIIIIVIIIIIIELGQAILSLRNGVGLEAKNYDLVASGLGLELCGLHCLLGKQCLDLKIDITVPICR